MEPTTDEALLATLESSCCRSTQRHDGEREGEREREGGRGSQDPTAGRLEGSWLSHFQAADRSGKADIYSVELDPGRVKSSEGTD